jgi:hypothetical protein
MDTRRCYLTLRVVSECLQSKPHAQHFEKLFAMLKYHHILDTKQCKTIITLSDHKGKQLIRDTIQKGFLQDS